MNNHPQRRIMLWINLLGGTAVLASYAHGLSTHLATRAQLWGHVPPSLLPLYGACMLAAAACYLAFTYWIFFCLNPDEARIAGRFGFGLFNLLYTVILVPSALWMPLTFAMMEQPSSGLWLAIRLTLASVGMGSLGLLVALLTLRPRQPAWAYGLAVIGCIAFCVQTALLDAWVWPAFFPASL